MKQYYSFLNRTFRFSFLRNLQVKKNSIRLLLSAAFIFVVMTGNATIYYVSTSGNDSNAGTSSNSPWKSLAKVNSFSFKPGDQILFKRGDQWTGTITVSAAGTSGSPILYGAYGTGAKPKIYGAEKITNWTKHSGNIYKATVGKPVNQVFVNDAKMKVARYPNSGYFKISSVQSGTRFTSTELSTGINYTGASWFGRTGYYFNPTHNVISSSSNSITLDAVPQKDLNVGEGFFLMNKLAFLDQAGEWSYDPGSKTVYLWLPNGDSPANYNVTGSTYDRGLYASGKNYITVQGLEFLHQAGKGIEIYNCNNWVIDGNDFTYPDGYAVMEESKGEYHTISNNKVIGANHIGFQLRTSNSKVIDNVLTDIGLYDNLGITGNGKYYYGSAIFIGGQNNVIRHNRIIDINYNGIFFAGPNNLIEYNFIENTCLMKGDGGGIYTTQPGTNPTTGSVVKHNIVINTVGSNQGFTSSVQFGEGIYIDESAHGVTVEYNTVYKSSNAGIKLHRCDANIVRYNTVMDSRMALHVLNHSGSTKTKIHNNIFYSTGNGDVNKYEPRQLMIRVSSPNAEINNNTYRNPYESTGIFRGDSYWSFADWKSKMGYDSNSTCNHTKLNSGEKEKLFYNDTKQEKSFNLGSKVYKDIHGKQVAQTFTLKPFTSVILIETNSQTAVEENKSPVIQDQFFEFTAPKRLNDFLAQVVASDPDAGQELSYSVLEGNEEGLFALSATTGKIYAKKDINVAVDKTIKLLVQVKDNAANPKSATATITVTIRTNESNHTVDATAPVISSFSVPATVSSLVVPVTITASDNVAVTGWKLTETATAPKATDAGWASAAPTEYTFTEEGTKTLYAWAKDAAGNVSVSLSKSVIISLATPGDSVEYVTICEGEEYLGWTESGVYERKESGGSSVVNTGTNQLLNPDFSGGLTGWNSWSATGYNINLIANSSDYKSAPASLQIDCTANGTSVSSIQLMNRANVKIEAGKVYSLTFYAKATTEFSIGNIYVHKASSPYTNYGSFDTGKPVIKTSWNQYSLKFTANQDATDGSFRIYLGNSLPAGHSVIFDDFVFAEYSEETISNDEVIITYLTVNQASATTEEVTIAEGEEYMGWTKTGEYSRTLESAAGCDSTITTMLLVLSEKEIVKEGETEYVTICEGEAYKGWTESGVYEWIRASESGAGIPVITYLTVEATKYVTETIKINSNEDYNGWNVSGHYERVLQSASGCDSVVVTKLIVRGKGSEDDESIKFHQPIISKGNKKNDPSLDGAGGNEFLLYPNPAQTFINVEYSKQPDRDTKIEIIDAGGRTVHSQEAGSTRTRIDFDQLNPGMYYLRSVTSQSQQVQKFIIR